MGYDVFLSGTQEAGTQVRYLLSPDYREYVCGIKYPISGPDSESLKLSCDCEVYSKAKPRLEKPVKKRLL